MKILVIQTKMGMGDMIIFLSYIHAIAQKENLPVSILVKESSQAIDILSQDKHIDKIIILDRKKKIGKHNGILGFFSIVKELKKENYEKVYIFNSSIRYALLAKFAGIKNIFQYPLFKKSGQNIVKTAKKFTEKFLNVSVSTKSKIIIDKKLILETK